MKVYLAGAMTGHPDLNFPAFHAAAAKLRAAGFEVVNPAEIKGADELVAYAAMTPAEMSAYWQKCMRADIAALVTCDAIALLPGWEKSKGATLEHRIAGELGLRKVDIETGAVTHHLSKEEVLEHVHACIRRDHRFVKSAAYRWGVNHDQLSKMVRGVRPMRDPVLAACGLEMVGEHVFRKAA
ncbi:MAG: hypothetical protein JWR21_903 [Herminiimonas sp.]|nr:hypothetical protein [Herminiimonas sp.]